MYSDGGVPKNFYNKFRHSAVSGSNFSSQTKTLTKTLVKTLKKEATAHSMSQTEWFLQATIM